MRISDCSSDVCSSYLQAMEKPTSIGRIVRHGWAAYRRVMRLLQLLIILLFLPGAGCLVESRDAEPRAEALDYNAMRTELVRQVAIHAKSLGPATGVAEIDPRVLEAMAAVPRDRKSTRLKSSHECASRMPSSP